MEEVMNLDEFFQRWLGGETINRAQLYQGVLDAYTEIQRLRKRVKELEDDTKPTS
jgi:hypothetical protein